MIRAGSVLSQVNLDWIRFLSVYHFKWFLGMFMVMAKKSNLMQFESNWLKELILIWFG